MPRAAPLGGLSPGAFLRRHWQKKPLLIRNAFADAPVALSPEELAGLACEQGVESRLVIRTGRKPYWKLHHGPFRTRDFTRLPKRRWTLLVQDVDKHVPGFAPLLDAFCFIPNWRIDDVMVSYATDGGSVGPHVDAYDVFLLQVRGLRRWDITTRPQAEVRLPGLELKQVREFEPEDSWLLGPGDMLYLPPGVAHHGVALGDCMTYSIGFRAPSQHELVSDLSGVLAERAANEFHYRDPDLRPAVHPGELTETARKRIRALVRSSLTLDNLALDNWFGCFITESKDWLRTERRRKPMRPDRLRQAIRGGGTLQWDPAVRTAWFVSSGRVHLFVDGTHHDLPVRLIAFVRLMADHRRIAGQELRRWLGNKVSVQLLGQWVNAGKLLCKK